LSISTDLINERDPDGRTRILTSADFGTAYLTERPDGRKDFIGSKAGSNDKGQGRSNNSNAQALLRSWKTRDADIGLGTEGSGSGHLIGSETSA